MKLKTLIQATGLTALLGVSVGAFAVEVDPALPAYQKNSGVSGKISSVGSDTLGNSMVLWAEGFKRMYPNVNIQIQAAGSSTAPTALIAGTSNIGPMSRMMKDKEIADFEKQFGYKPTAVAVAIDTLAVYVNKDNPVEGLSIDQVDAIFSKTRKCGSNTDMATWGDVGVTGPLAKQPFQLYGRNSVSGTYGYFKAHGLCKGDFKATVNEQPGSASVVQSVAESVNGIGYSGIGYITSGVRALPLAKKGSKKYVEVTPENAVNGSYPLSRLLYVYVNKEPGKPLSPQITEFLTYVLSAQGQNDVIKSGFIPLPAKVAQAQMAKIK